MPKHKKKFIDKKNAVTFNLVHRSQHDPLVADEKAPQHVLVAADSRPKKNANKEEEHKFGIYFDDDYDYLQHLRDTSKQAVHWDPVPTASSSNFYKTIKTTDFPGDTANEEEEVYVVERSKQLTLPSSVFASEVEEDVGLLNKAAPVSGLRLDLDPDIVAAMDEDFDFSDPSNELEDDFVLLANQSGESEYESAQSDDNFNLSDDDLEHESEDDDELSSLNGRQHMFDEEETKSRFTEYSMSSSVIRRNEQLSLLDHRFEKMFAAYDDQEIGALDCEDIEGYVPATSQILLQCADEFDRERATEKGIDDVQKFNLSAISDDSDEDLRTVELKDSDEGEKWDCQSILSTYSNIYNRPKLISERKINSGKIHISSKTGLPVGVFDSGSEKLTAKSLAKLNSENEISNQNDLGRAESIISTLSTLSLRPKNETPEERRARKRALKVYRRERIMERKANTEAFKEEKKRLEKVLLNNKKNIPTLHIN